MTAAPAPFRLNVTVNQSIRVYVTVTRNGIERGAQHG
jgi:hypothetical protein